MKKVLFILTVLLLPLFTEAQVIDWKNFNERHMDTVMFNTMNSYIYYGHNEHEGDYLVWSPVVQKEVMSSNYEFIKNRTHQYRNLKSLHNPKWLNDNRNSKPLPDSIKNKIIEENINPIYTDIITPYKFKSLTGGDNYFTANPEARYIEILVCLPRITCQTYQEIASHSIHLWNKSTEGHAGIMNANYKKKVIVGTTTFYCEKTHRVFISFVYIS